MANYPIYYHAIRTSVNPDNFNPTGQVKKSCKRDERKEKKLINEKIKDVKKRDLILNYYGVEVVSLFIVSRV